MSGRRPDCDAWPHMTSRPRIWPLVIVLAGVVFVVWRCA